MLSILMFNVIKVNHTEIKKTTEISKEIKEKILEAIEDFRQDYEQNDDITFVILKSVKK